MNLRKTILFRYTLLMIGIVLICLAIVIKVLYIQASGSKQWDQKIKTFENTTTVIPGTRGNICTHDGRVLVTSVPYYEIRFDLGAPAVRQIFKGEVSALASKLSTVFRDRSAATFKQQLLQAYNKRERYYLIHPRKVNWEELQRIREFPIFERGLFKGGFMAIQENVRLQPNGDLATRTLGLTNKGAMGGMYGSMGISGIECKYEKYLRGDDGLSLRQNLSGRWVNLTKVEPKNGMDVISTINVFYQDVATSALKRQLLRTSAESGSVVLMETETGKVRAIANLSKVDDGQYREIYNFAIGHAGCSEPGSTFKLATIMIALEDGVIDTSDVFDVGDGSWSYMGNPIYDSEYGREKYGKMSVKRIFERSSNVGFAKIFTKFYKGQEKKFVSRINDLGLNEPLDLGFQGEGIPYIRQPNKTGWSGLSLAWMSYGYEVKLTPIHILTLYNAVANDGKMVKPMFVDRVVKNGSTVKSYDTEVMQRSICSNSTLRKVRSLLEGVVQNGTAKSISTSQYGIAGKTGTALIADLNKGYTNKKYLASFAGYFPAENPKYSCIVVVYDPKGDYYGSSVAAPVFRELSDCVFATDLTLKPSLKRKVEDPEEVLPPVFNGLPEETKLVCRKFDLRLKNFNDEADYVSTTEKSDENRVYIKSRNIVEGQMPNTFGMGASDAVYLIEQAGMRASMRGIGAVRKQSPQPGARCQNGQVVYIELD